MWHPGKQSRNSSPLRITWCPSTPTADAGWPVQWARGWVSRVGHNSFVNWSSQWVQVGIPDISLSLTTLAFTPGYSILKTLMGLWKQINTNNISSSGWNQGVCLQNAITVKIDLPFLFSLQDNLHYRLDKLGWINNSIEPGWKIRSILIMFHYFYHLSFVLAYSAIASMTEEKENVLRWPHKSFKGSSSDLVLKSFFQSLRNSLSMRPGLSGKI